MKLNRRQWLARSVIYGGGFAGFGYGSGIEKRWLDVTRLTVPLHSRHANLAGLKIAVMGDFHHDDFGDQRLIRSAVEVVNEADVDFVFLVGDYISDDASAIVPLCEELHGLRPRRATFGVFGNHDRIHYDPLLKSSLEEAGVRLLDNTAEEFPGFAVAGIDSFLTWRADLPGALQGLPMDLPVLLIWHEPDTFDLHDDPRIALQVSGHTHGGQICAPFVGPLHLPKCGRKYPYGLFRRGPASLFVTRGIGTLAIPARFLCPPEVAVLTLAV